MENSNGNKTSNLEDFKTLVSECILIDPIVRKLTSIMDWDSLCNLCMTSRRVWSAFAPVLYGIAEMTISDHSLEDARYMVSRSSAGISSMPTAFIMPELITRVEFSEIQDMDGIAEILSTFSENIREVSLCSNKPVWKGNLGSVWKILATKNLQVLKLSLSRDCYNKAEFCGSTLGITSLQLNFSSCEKNFFSLLMSHLPNLAQVWAPSSDDAFVLRVHFYYQMYNTILQKVSEDPYVFKLAKPSSSKRINEMSDAEAAFIQKNREMHDKYTELLDQLLERFSSK